ncbi:MAG: phosphoribosylaminoimidazolesuccinocarboxamide synthase [Chloroflexi bacterium]|nr:phosphoribosylaminoimidazolesuccinocarboxamide synthase [Chloroflexota bacterium]
MLIETQLPDLLHRGKVRDTYQIDADLLLMVTTDRISAFDVVLPTGIPEKGRILNKMSGFWFDKTKHLIPNHLVALADDPDVAGKFSDSELMRNLPAQVARQAMIVKKAERIDIECVVRGYITGSAWSEYQKQGTVSGQRMPSGMVEGDAFPEPLFTPTTKAEQGHDENMTAEEVIAIAGADLARQLEEVTKTVYRFGHDYARERGIVLADTKLEFGLLHGELILIDELFTPDSSRFWDMDGFNPGRSQPSFDKQIVRDWLIEQGWDREPPAPELPPDIVARTSERYLEAYRRLTGAGL